MNRLPSGYGESRCYQDNDGKQIKDGSMQRHLKPRSKFRNWGI
jgi:hypothetical protein